MEKKYQFIVVGSGAGGATIARDLTKSGKSVLIIEKGKNETKIGTFLDSLKYYDCNKITRIPKKSKEGTILWRSFMAGGTTMVSMGNGTRCLEQELADLNISLKDEFEITERELGVEPIPNSLLSQGSVRIRDAAEGLGYRFVNMPKFVDPQKCQKCGHCSLGCIYDAKWTSYNYLSEAFSFGAEILYEAEVEKVIIEKDKVKGVAIKSKNQKIVIESDVVILAAGGLGTPIILQNSGFKDAGKNLFIDIVVNTYGQTKDFGMMNEPQMSLVDLDMREEKGFILSTCIQHPKEVRLIEMGMGGFMMPTNRTLGIMSKIADDSSGMVYQDGSVSKSVTKNDQEKIDQATKISTEILIKAGARPETIRYSIPQGAHPGGTAAIGKIVDSHLETECKNLFVCDASVLPKSPGLPPILTIVALANRLGKELLL